MQRIINSILCVLVILAMAISVAVAAPPATGRYIVVLNDNVASPAAAASEIAQQVAGKVGYIYEHALKGFSIMLPYQALAALEKNPNVKYVATDDIRYTSAQTVPTGIQRIFADSNSKISINGSDDYRVDVDVAVIDTGIDLDHPDLNVAGGVDCTVSSSVGAPWTRTFYCSETEGTGGDDDHYHGTHVAGTIGAIDNGIGVVGVAPGARLWAVKVLDSGGSGYSSGIIAGIDWITAKGSIEVANMSLSGLGFNDAEYDAIQGAVSVGVAFAVAAGNNDADASNYSPAAFDNVLTVSALADFDGDPGGLGSATCRTDQDDTLADFSNWGAAVDIAAPGVCILSTFPLEYGEYGGYGTISGTSMASPHVAGALALLASGNNKPISASEVSALYNKIKVAGNKDWVDDSGDGIQEPLLDVSDSSVFLPFLIATGGGTPSTNDPPIADFTFDTSDLTANFTDTSTDSDGTIFSRFWDFGDGSSSTVQNPSHTYAADGSYTVTLTVTDNDEATASVSKQVTVSSSVSSGITLTATSKSNRNWVIVDLIWSGANSSNVVIYRDENIIITTSNDGSYTDKIPNTGSGSVDYKVCEADNTSICSKDVTVSWEK